MAAPLPLAFTTVQDRKRLLELYPISVLRDRWNREGTKDELCFSVATDAPQQEIVEFAHTFLGCCRQHVHIYSHNANINNLPAIQLPDAVRVSDTMSDGQRQILRISAR